MFRILSVLGMGSVSQSVESPANTKMQKKKNKNKKKKRRQADICHKNEINKKKRK